MTSIDLINVENAKLVEVPDIIQLFNDFEEFLEKSIGLKKVYIQNKTSVFSEDLIQKKYQCQFLKTRANGEAAGLVLSSTSLLAGVGPVLLLTLLYAKEQKKGFGKTLLFNAIQEAEKQINGHIKQVHFLCNTENTPAWEFYKRLNAQNLTVGTGFILCEIGLTDDMSNRSKSDVTVRAAQESDLHQLVELFKELREKHSVPVWTEERIEESNLSLLDNVYVVEDVKSNGRSDILGMISFYYRYGMLSNNTPVIVGFMVKDGHRRCGIGTTLINYMKQMWVFQHGCKFANVLLPPDVSSPGRRFFSHFPHYVNRTEENTWNYCLFDRPSY